MAAVAPQDEAAQASGGVTAFSKQRAQLRGMDVGEVAELEALMAQLEGADEEQAALEDDFIFSATQARTERSSTLRGCGTALGQVSCLRGKSDAFRHLY